MTELVKIRSGNWELSGVVHTPQLPPERRAGVLVLHENFNTKFGTHRMFYQLGEALAAAGLYALRHDNRGTCDSSDIHSLTFEDRVADACAAARFFKNEYRLDSIFFWGLCMGGAVALHSSAQLMREQPQGMMLCSLLADPLDASLPQSGYDRVNLNRFVEGVSRGNLLRKASRLVTDSTYRQKVGRFLTRLITRSSARNPELVRLQGKISQVGRLLSEYTGPIVLVFGDKALCWAHFAARVNVNDKLALARMGSRRTLLLMENGDHTFSSLQQTEKLIAWTVEWAEGLRDGSQAQFAYSKVGVNRGIPVASIAD
ncbi:MAG TPA: alpha/beta fold hydrolase [Terriglobales bacterium]